MISIEEIREIVRARNITPAQLADLMSNIEGVEISRQLAYERLNSPNPTLKTILRITKAMGL